MSKALAVGAASIVALGLGGTFAYTLMASADLSQCATTSTSTEIGGPFELLDKNGDLVKSEDLIVEPVLIYFGFTFCPDFCPIDMGRNVAAVDILAEQGISTTPIFISIDPERDTPEVVGDYANAYHEKAIGLTGSPEQVKAASQAYRTFYQKDNSGDPEFYLMQHTTFTYLTLPEHGFVEFFRTDASPEEVAETVACFVAEA
ncbi:MAG: SCO family protein [Pseudomonadota bacterium]